MKICFPIRKQNGDEYSTVEEVMGLTGREPHGSWLAGTNQLWHGGIHISQTSAPGSVLTADNADSAVPLQCMAKGEIVAWRLNQDYKKADYSGKELKYSTTFILVKSICQPDPEKENSWLEFYSLYMGLAPLSVFSKSLCYKAKTVVKKRAASNYVSSASSDGIAVAPPKCGTLTKDKRVIVLKQTQFRNDGQTQPFGLARSLSDSGEMVDETFWVSLLPEFMEPDGEQYVQMSEWMKKAVALGKFDEVVKPPEKLEIAAGDAVGFLGEDIAPAGRSNTDSCHYVHIEVISNDTRMPEFLNNPAGITSGQKYIRLHPGADLYTKSGEGEQSVFTKTTSQTEKDSGKVLCVADCNPFEDSQHKTWYKVSDNSWMSRDGIDLLNQYDLKELGFNTLEEAPSPDVSKSLREDWVKGAYDWLSERVGKERGIQQKQVSAFYKNLVKKIDSDGDGELSGKELYNALHHPELGLRDIAARLVVKHDSEWFGGSSHHRWSVFFQNYDRLRMAYAKQWLDDCEWMSKVDAFRNGAPVWHFHPVVFCSALKDGDQYEITVEMIEALLGHKNPWFTGKSGGKTFAKNFQKDYPNVFEFDKQSFVSMLKKTMTEYGIIGPYHKAHFLSQCLHESAHLDTTLEFGSGKNYDPGRHPDAMKYENTTVGDGPKYRGRGLIQLTWKKNYRLFSLYSGENVVIDPDLVADNMENTIKASAWFWRNNGGIFKKFNANGDINILIDNDKNNVELITKAVNGGRNGLPERQKYFDAIKKEWNLE